MDKYHATWNILQSALEHPRANNPQRSNDMFFFLLLSREQFRRFVALHSQDLDLVHGLPI